MIQTKTHAGVMSGPTMGACLPKSQAVTVLSARTGFADISCLKHKAINKKNLRWSRTHSTVWNTANIQTELLSYGLSCEQGRRDTMEDYAAVMPSQAANGYLYAGVFDGHGGETAARVLSQSLDKSLASKMSSMSAKSSEEELSATLTSAFFEFDESLMNILEGEDGEERNCGSTATVCLVWKNRLLVANVGDSRAVISRRGRAVDLTAEHRPYGKNTTSVREVERIKESGGWITDGRVMGILAVSRAFGDLEFKRGLEQLLVDGVLSKLWSKSFAKAVEFTAPPVVVKPDVLSLTLNPDDKFLIVATDGLWEVTTSAQAVRFVERFLSKESSVDSTVMQRCTEALVKDAVVRRRTSDNVGAVVIKLSAEEEDVIPGTPPTVTDPNFNVGESPSDSMDYIDSYDESTPVKIQNFFKRLFGRNKDEL